jgi:hypothetical protein
LLRLFPELKTQNKSRKLLSIGTFSVFEEVAEKIAEIHNNYVKEEVHYWW